MANNRKKKLRGWKNISGHRTFEILNNSAKSDPHFRKILMRSPDYLALKKKFSPI